MNKKKVIDEFSKVEADAKKLLNDPQKHGAAKTVLEYIERQRKNQPKGINNKS